MGHQVTRPVLWVTGQRGTGFRVALLPGVCARRTPSTTPPLGARTSPGKQDCPAESRTGTWGAALGEALVQALPPRW